MICIHKFDVCLDNAIISSGLTFMKIKVTMEAALRTEVSSPMILTGYAALNKLLGKNVYSSQARPRWTKEWACLVLMILVTYMLHNFCIPLRSTTIH